MNVANRNELCGSIADQIIEDSNLATVKQNRTHKSKRINKKYSKKYGETVTPSPYIMMTPFGLFAHPETKQKAVEFIDKHAVEVSE
jgi:hypothetical protein